MLAAMAAILKSALEAGLVLVLFLIGLSKAGLGKQKKTVYFATLGSAILAVILAYAANFFGDREVFEGYLSLVVTLAASGFVLWIWRVLRWSEVNEDFTGKPGILLTVFLILDAGVLVLGKMIEIVVFPSSVFLMKSNLLNTEVVVKLAGAFLGLIITAVFIFIFLLMERRISRREFMIFSSAVLSVVILRQVITGLQVLFATGVLRLTTWAVTILAPLINSYYPAFFYTLVGMTFILWGLLRNKVNKDYPDTASAPNSAKKRKLMAGFIKEKRQLKFFGTCLFSVILILGGNMAFANKGAKIEPPLPVSAQDGKILIPMEQVNDGKLHRYSYMTAQNVETRFVVIRKGENLYGTGLDACDICGQAGYYQRGNEVICKNCDVVINIPTIGFPGGCNPIPIKNSREGTNLVINTVDLEAKQEVFRE